MLTFKPTDHQDPIGTGCKEQDSQRHKVAYLKIPVKEPHRVIQKALERKRQWTHFLSLLFPRSLSLLVAGE